VPVCSRPIKKGAPAIKLAGLCASTCVSCLATEELVAMNPFDAARGTGSLSERRSRLDVDELGALQSAITPGPDLPGATPTAHRGGCRRLWADGTGTFLEIVAVELSGTFSGVTVPNGTVGRAESDDGVGPSDGRDARDKELVCVEVFHGVAAGRGDVCPGVFQARGHGGAGSACAAAHDRALAG
jgi:hypothetical protein